MNDELISIKVQIANRSYPLKVKQGQEQSIRKAAEAINQHLKEFENSYSVRDHQDLLAMYTLQLTTEQMGLQSEQINRQSEIQSELDRLSQLVKSFNPEND